MRIWDIDPGYLSRQSLLGEHSELHGIVSIVTNRKKGYCRHPETMRWINHGWALRQRHTCVACEMALRGLSDKSPVISRSSRGMWPQIYIDEPANQFQLLAEKYANKEGGRIPLPKNEQELWSHHKYSVLARHQKTYREIGRSISTARIDFPTLAIQLIEILRIPPTEGGMMNALQHMWDYVSREPFMKEKR
jgi:hypothetical protein